jgi:putative hydrolase of the HAD superfamily
MIKTLIFDFGGVLYNIDYFASINALAKLSSRPELLVNMHLNNILELPDNFEKGLINTEEFRNFLRKEYFINASDSLIDDCWNKMLKGIKPESVEFIKSLKNKYKIALLSNTNQIHYDYFIGETQDLIDVFENVFFSYQINLRKPDEDIYKYVCEKLNCKPEETLFIDDSFINIQGAERAGLNTFHFTKDKILSDLFHTI